MRNKRMAAYVDLSLMKGRWQGYSPVRFFSGPTKTLIGYQGKILCRDRHDAHELRMDWIRGIYRTQFGHLLFKRMFHSRYRFQISYLRRQRI